MKAAFYTLFMTGILLLLTACNKDEYQDWRKDYDGIVTAHLNGQEMVEVFVQGSDEQQDTTRRPGISIKVFQSTYIPNEGGAQRNFIFSQLTKANGRYDLNPRNDNDLPSASHITTRGDVGLDGYELNLDFENFIEIQSISEDGFVSGIFQSSFIRKDLQEVANSSISLDTVTVTDGQFKVKLQSRE